MLKYPVKHKYAAVVMSEMEKILQEQCNENNIVQVNERPWLIVPNDVAIIINTTISGLTKPFYDYSLADKCYYKKILTEKGYADYLVEEEERKRRKEEAERAEREKIEAWKQRCSDKEAERYKKAIGDYYTDPLLMYGIWKSIEQRYGICWRRTTSGDLLLREDVCNDVQNTYLYGELKGTTFLKRKFRYRGRTHEIIGTYAINEDTEVEKKGGIYGIYLGDELIYIGMTLQNFSDRFQQHKDILNKFKPVPSGMKLYGYVWENSDGKEIKFEKLLEIKNINVKSYSKRDIEAMELAFISYFKPVCNLRGNTMEYEFS